MLYKIYSYIKMLTLALPDIFIAKKIKFYDCIKLIKEKDEHMDANLRMYDGYRRWIHLSRYIFTKNYNFNQNDNILDIACWMWYWSDYLSKDHKSITWVDLSSTSIDYAKKYYQSDNIEFIQWDASDIKLPNKYDKITSFETIEHLPDSIIKDYLKTLYIHLNDDWLLFISSPNKWWKTQYHFQDFDYNDFKEILEQNGFSVIESYKQNSWDLENKFNHWEMSWIYKIENDKDKQNAEIIIFICKKIYE